MSEGRLARRGLVGGRGTKKSGALGFPRGAAARAWPLAAVLLLVVVGTGRLARAAGPQRWLLQPVEARGLDPGVAHSVERALLAELGRSPGVEVVSQREIVGELNAAVLQEELTGEGELERRLASARQRLGAEHLVTAKLGLMGTQWTLSVAVLDLRSGLVHRRSVQRAADYRSLLAEVPAAAGELTGAAEAAPRFRLQRDSNRPLQLAVVPLEALGVPSSMAETMTRVLTAEYARVEGVRVLSRADIEALLQQIEITDELGCLDDTQCLARVGAAFGLAHLVTGSVGRVDRTWVLSLSLIDSRKSRVAHRVLEAYDGDAEELPRALTLAAHRLLGVGLETRPGSLDFSFNVDRAEVHLGVDSSFVRDSRFRLPSLPPGRYPLRVVPEGDSHVPLSTDIYVAPDQRSGRRFELEETPPRWYQKWWVWAIAGAAATAAGTTTVFLLSEDEGGTIRNAPAGAN